MQAIQLPVLQVSNGAGLDIIAEGLYLILSKHANHLVINHIIIITIVRLCDCHVVHKN